MAIVKDWGMRLTVSARNSASATSAAAMPPRERVKNSARSIIGAAAAASARTATSFAPLAI